VLAVRTTARAVALTAGALPALKIGTPRSGPTEATLRKVAAPAFQKLPALGAVVAARASAAEHRLAVLRAAATADTPAVVVDAGELRALVVLDAEVEVSEWVAKVPFG